MLPAIESCDAAIREVAVVRSRDGAIQHMTDQVAEEVPVALRYHSIPHAVMLATPSDLEDLAVGFTISEQLVERVEQIRGVTLTRTDDGELAVEIAIDAKCFAALLRRRRNMTSRGGCGLCGVETIEDAVRDLGSISSATILTEHEMHAALLDLSRWQRVNAEVGSVHAAAWLAPGKGIQLVREDVGRHNALDKLIGALVRRGETFETGYFLVTSRASFELVQKAIVVGACGLIAVSAPTALAIRLAEQYGLTLIGFARRHQHVVYAHGERVGVTGRQDDASGTHP